MEQLLEFAFVLKFELGFSDKLIKHPIQPLKLYLSVQEYK